MSNEVPEMICRAQVLDNVVAKMKSIPQLA